MSKRTRLLALSLALSPVLALWSGAVVWARTVAVLDLGESLMSIPELAHTTGHRRVHVNGAVLELEAEHLDVPLAASLNMLHRRCLQRGTGAANALSGALGDRSNRRPWRSLPLDGVLRGGADSSGHVACFESGEAEAQGAGLVQRVRRAAQSGDLAQLGTLRVAFARAEQSGTSVLTLRSLGPLRPARMFPQQGDAPGSDPPGVPRPPGLRRVLSAFQQDAAPHLALYQSSTLSVEQALRSYEVELRSSDSWTLLSPKGARRQGVLLASRSQRLLLLHATANAPAQRTQIAVAVLR